MCYQLSFMGLCYIEKFHTYTLQEFKAVQIVRLEEVMDVVCGVSDSVLVRTLPLSWVIVHTHACLGDRAPRWFPKWGKRCGQEVVPLRPTCCRVYSWWLCIWTLWGYVGRRTGRVPKGRLLRYYLSVFSLSLQLNFFQTSACMHKLFAWILSICFLGSWVVS